MTHSDDDEFDRRLSLEIIPDAYGPEEQALSWYYYLEEHLQFPFKAECVSDRSTSPLRIGDKVDVVGMPNGGRLRTRDAGQHPVERASAGHTPCSTWWS